MADIWSGIGVDIDKDEGEWLFRIGTDVRGPMPHRMLVEKLLNGDIDVNTPVAREGTEFHPLIQVQAFAPHLENARRRRAERESRKSLKLKLGIMGIVIALVAGIGVFLRLEFQKRQRAEERRIREAALQAAKNPPPKPDDNLPRMGLVALVSLGTEQDVKISGGGGGDKLHHEHTKHHGPKTQGPSGPEEPEEEVQSCKLTQQEIFGTLRGALGKLNVCVEDEKKRDTQGLLPPTLGLEFVVKPNGKVTEFAIDDRHYRTGPLNNCLIKAFNTISFPTSTGANCPVTIPIKIGK